MLKGIYKRTSWKDLTQINIYGKIAKKALSELNQKFM